MPYCFISRYHKRPFSVTLPAKGKEKKKLSALQSGRGSSLCDVAGVAHTARGDQRKDSQSSAEFEGNVLNLQREHLAALDPKPFWNVLQVLAQSSADLTTGCYVTVMFGQFLQYGGNPQVRKPNPNAATLTSAPGGKIQ